MNLKAATMGPPSKERKERKPRSIARLKPLTNLWNSSTYFKRRVSRSARLSP